MAQKKERKKQRRPATKEQKMLVRKSRFAAATPRRYVERRDQ